MFQKNIKLVNFLDVVGHSGQEAMDYMNKEQFMVYRGQATKETTERQKGNIDRFLKDYIGCTVIIPHFVGNRMIGEVRSQINEDGSLNTPEYVLF